MVRITARTRQIAASEAQREKLENERRLLKRKLAAQTLRLNRCDDALVKTKERLKFKGTSTPIRSAKKVAAGKASWAKKSDAEKAAVRDRLRKFHKKSGTPPTQAVLQDRMTAARLAKKRKRGKTRS